MTDQEIKTTLDELEATLSQSLIDARSDRLEQAADTIDRMTELLAELAGIAGPLSAHAEQVRQVHQLYGELQLVLAQKKDDVGKQIGNSARGQAGLSVYRNANARDERPAR